MLRKLSILLVLVSCLLMFGCKISGTITNEFGESLDGVEVVLNGQEGKMKEFTDANGKFAFNNLLPGKYTVTPSSSDMYDFTPASVQLLTETTIINFKGDDLWRFTDMGDGTVRDNDSGLVWLKDASCIDLPYTQSSSGGAADWYNAVLAAAALEDGICGLTDGSMAGNWRLPTLEEWEAFVCTSFWGPAIFNTMGDGQWTQGDPFNDVVSHHYWSSTEHNDEEAYGLDSYAGTYNIPFRKDSCDMPMGEYCDMYNYFLVWPVRTDN